MARVPLCHNIITEIPVKHNATQRDILQTYLTYGLVTVMLTQTQINKLNSGWNSIYRAVVEFKPRESVKEVQTLHGRLDLKHLPELNKLHLGCLDLVILC